MHGNRRKVIPQKNKLITTFLSIEKIPKNYLVIEWEEIVYFETLEIEIESIPHEKY
jgi:hypothetical protein